MKKLLVCGIVFLSWLFTCQSAFSIPAGYDTVPQIPLVQKADAIPLALELEAALCFNRQKTLFSPTEWESHKTILRKQVWAASGVIVDHNLPLDYHETGTIKRVGYTIKKIYFQTRKGVYVTANLYVPDGTGTFPAVINMHGHWEGGKAGEMVQSCAHELALNGYVCLNIDAWGSGERTTVHGLHEYHGSNLGASLMNIGETLLGAQLADNIRGVDLLSSLDYVDKNRIGATGASGGGNQTMWLSAMDDRIKAGMPVVSVGTFQAYIMASNCVCELLPAGLTLTEESGILSLVAPRALMIASALQDRNKAFFPLEMIRSFSNAKIIYDDYGKAENLAYSLFDTTHGYWPEMRQTLLGWFDLHLKGEGNGKPKKEIPFQLLPQEELMVFSKGKRSPLIVSTIEYCRKIAQEEQKKTDKSGIVDRDGKISELKKITLYSGDEFQHATIIKEDDNSERVILETVSNQQIPLRIYWNSAAHRPAVLLLFTDTQDGAGRKAIADDYLRRKYNVVVADLWGIGVNNSPRARAVDGSLPPFHTLARASFWLGQSVQGKWADNIRMIIEYMNSRFLPASITVDAEKEAGIAALVQADLYNNTDTCILRKSPVSYSVDDRKGIDFFDMSVHLPGIIPWGDISLLTAMSGCKVVEFQYPVSLSGRLISKEEQGYFEERVEREMNLLHTEGLLKFTKN